MWHSAAYALPCNFIRNFSHTDQGTDSTPACLVRGYLCLLERCMPCWLIKAIRYCHVGRDSDYTVVRANLLQPSADRLLFLLLQL